MNDLNYFRKSAAKELERVLTLNGGAGNDDLTGGLGQDFFAYSLLVDNLLGGADTIRDFRTSESDQIRLFGPPGAQRVNPNGDNRIDASDGPAASVVGGNLTIDLGAPPDRPDATGNTLTVLGVTELQIDSDIVFF
jgi:hypothetical protein